MGVPVRQRLRHSAEFTAVRNEGRRAFFDAFALQVKVPLEEEKSQNPGRRLGVIASRRVGNAVARNRCKRVLRDVFRKHQNLLPEDCDVVIIARKDCVEAEVAELGRQFARLVKRITRSPGV